MGLQPDGVGLLAGGVQLLALGRGWQARCSATPLYNSAGSAGHVDAQPGRCRAAERENLFNILDNPADNVDRPQHFRLEAYYYFNDLLLTRAEAALATSAKQPVARFGSARPPCRST